MDGDLVGSPIMVEPQSHCHRSVLGALDYSYNTLFYSIKSGIVTRDNMINFWEEVARHGVII